MNLSYPATGHFLKVTFISETNKVLGAILLVVHYKTNTLARAHTYAHTRPNSVNSDMRKNMVHVFSWKARDFSKKY